MYKNEPRSSRDCIRTLAGGSVTGCSIRGFRAVRPDMSNKTGSGIMVQLELHL